MSLEQLSKTVDFVQATTPSNANDGETYLDTSQSPPQLKVFDSSANAFVRPRSVQNLDAPVSGAGATQTDIETAVDNSNTASTVSNNLDAKVSSAGEGVDWSNKSFDRAKGFAQFQGGTQTLVSVTGSGYILTWYFRSGEAVDRSFSLSIDGSTVYSSDLNATDSGSEELYEVPGEPFVYFESDYTVLRFDSSFEVTATENAGGSETIFTQVQYVLD